MNIYINKFIELTHKLYQIQKDSLSFLLKGENGVLLYLNEEEEVTPSMISNVFKVSSARVASTLNSLEKKDYIKRIQSDKDKRVIYIKLTKAGNDEALVLKNQYYNSLNKLFAELGEEDTVKALEILEKTIAIINKSNAEGEDLC